MRLPEGFRPSELINKESIKKTLKLLLMSGVLLMSESDSDLKKIEVNPQDFPTVDQIEKELFTSGEIDELTLVNKVYASPVEEVYISLVPNSYFLLYSGDSVGVAPTLEDQKKLASTLGLFDKYNTMTRAHTHTVRSGEAYELFQDTTTDTSNEQVTPSMPPSAKDLVSCVMINFITKSAYGETKHFDEQAFDLEGLWKYKPTNELDNLLMSAESLIYSNDLDSVRELVGNPISADVGSKAIWLDLIESLKTIDLNNTESRVSLIRSTIKKWTELKTLTLKPFVKELVLSMHANPDGQMLQSGKQEVIENLIIQMRRIGFEVSYAPYIKEVK